VAAFARRHELVTARARVLIALSGGPDSCALLLSLKEAADAGQLPFPAGAAHFHHGLRGRDADEDAAFAASLCAGLTVPCVVGIGAVEPAGGRSPNDAARRARYNFLEEAARDLGAGVIATAHTADDQAETVLGRVLRGTSVDGLAGIPVRRVLAGGTLLVRPLLGVSRAEVEAYCAACHVTPRRDPSNETDRYARSRLRKRLPALAADFNPNLTDALVRLAAHAVADADLLGGLAEDLWERAARPLPGDAVELSRTALRDAHPALRRRVLLRAIRTVAGDAPAAEEAATSAFVAVLEDLLPTAREGKGRDLPGRIRVWAAGDAIRLCCDRSGVADASAPGAGYRERLTVPGRTHIPEAGITLIAAGRVAGSEPIRVRHSLVVDLALPAGAVDLVIRATRDGDRIAPLGMGGRTRLVHDILAEGCVPVADRAVAPLVVSADTDEILWVVGLVQAEATRVNPDSTRVVRLTAERL
jgi:tRNA(Ile)-lysidine synthase